ncbi:MAG TPA: twin-arginine translocase TatA/TatE family subunit [Pyrinomonadaceae bacterium]|jgi:sec-independent protein translocase protein TatA
MNQIILLGFMPQGTEWLLILLVILLIFGGTKLPQLAKALGQSKRAFKEGQREAEEEERLEELQRQESNKNLSSLSDEELVAEARRREGLRSANTRTEEDKLLK